MCFSRMLYAWRDKIAIILHILKLQCRKLHALCSAMMYYGNSMVKCANEKRRHSCGDACRFNRQVYWYILTQTGVKVNTVA